MQTLADDYEHPAPAALLAVPNEAKQLALGLSCGEAVQIALRFDLEPWILERINDARVRRLASPDDDSIAFVLDA